MWKATLIMFVAFAAFVGAILASVEGTLDGRRNDPCVAVPAACAPEPEPTTTAPPPITTTPSTTASTTVP